MEGHALELEAEGVPIDREGNLQREPWVAHECGEDARRREGFASHGERGVEQGALGVFDAHVHTEAPTRPAKGPAVAQRHGEEGRDVEALVEVEHERLAGRGRQHVAMPLHPRRIRDLGDDRGQRLAIGLVAEVEADGIEDDAVGAQLGPQPHRTRRASPQRPLDAVARCVGQRLIVRFEVVLTPEAQQRAATGAHQGHALEQRRQLVQVEPPGHEAHTEAMHTWPTAAMTHVAGEERAVPRS